jgi:hypothetical protein
LIMVPFIILFSTVNPQEYAVLTDFTKNSFDSSGFGILNTTMAKTIDPAVIKGYSFLSVMGIKIQIFIAFAYLYHYLNWFSKTSIIRWNQNMSKAKIITILTIWIASVSLYLYNFKIGVIALSLLSVIHVFLEFPLNVTSVKGIVGKVKSQFIS